ncbi:Uncharacterised protein [Klebsiella pneumoniae]|nr:Uncharacterised protein [Klebsiella pneumoniae]
MTDITKLARERLEKIKSWRETYGAGSNVMLPAEEAEELARIALAAMDSEPVAWTWHYREQWHVTSDKGRAAFVAIDGDVAVLPLYRHAQPTVDREPVGYFRRYDPDFDALITQCDKGAQDSFPLYLHAQSEPIEANIARDAQRYRFLRDKDAFGDDGEPGLASWDELIDLDMNEFDAAIDARMAHPSVDFLTLDNALQKQERRRCKDRNCNKQIFGYSVDGLCEDCYTAVSQQPAPVVSADLLHTAASAIEDLLEHTDPNTSYYSGVWADVPGKLRAAMLQAKSLASINPAPALCSLSKTGEVLHTNSPVITDEGGATIIDVKYPFLRACSSICLVL